MKLALITLQTEPTSAIHVRAVKALILKIEEAAAQYDFAIIGLCIVLGENTEKKEAYSKKLSD